MQTQITGKLGEDFASRFLQTKGYKILQRNFRAQRYGEVDIIALHPNGKTLVFVEVKTRKSDQFGTPQEAVGRKKLLELRKMVDYFFNLHPDIRLSPQIDVIAISLENNQGKIQHLENVTL